MRTSRSTGSGCAALTFTTDRVPTLAALLRPVHERPRYFQRGSDIIDRERGGFRSETFDTAEACEAAARHTRGHFCFDTRQVGNSNGGHEYGTSLDEARRDDLLTYPGLSDA